MKRIALLLLATLLPAQALHASPSLTLDQALTTAQKNHPSKRASLDRMARSQASVSLCMSTSMPRADVSH